MNQYFAYGLGIHSEISFPELEPAQADADVVIRTGHVECAFADEKSAGVIVQAISNEATAFYNRVGSARIRAGKEIVVDPIPEVDEQELRLFLLGPVFAALLHQRGNLVLHASAAAVQGQAIAFLGAPGGGKSTTAAAFVARGYPLVTDDILAISFDGDHMPTTRPAFPFIKIWPQAAEALGANVSAAPRVNPLIEKRVHRVGQRFAASPLPLGRVYVLAEGEQTQVEALSPQEAFVELVRHTFVLHLLDTPETASAHFQQCSVLATRVPVRRLIRQSSLDALTALTELVERDLAADPGSNLKSPHAR